MVLSPDAICCMHKIVNRKFGPVEWPGTLAIDSRLQGRVFVSSPAVAENAQDGLTEGVWLHDALMNHVRKIQTRIGDNDQSLADLKRTMA